jgi:murein DD-endopeptidase MepM/ murein hydrolase activator NlpD
VRTRSRAALAAAIATTLTVLSGAPAGAGFDVETAHAFGFPSVPVAVFPLPAAPQYGDGLGAGREHQGQDLFAPAGTPELAIADAIVLEAASGDNGGRGNYVSIYSPAADRTYNYFHMLAAPLVAAGDPVRAGQKLGELGCTGSCWGDHLHFEVREGRDPYGPVLDTRPLLERLAPAA